jgi:hypothetical protein
MIFCLTIIIWDREFKFLYYSAGGSQDNAVSIATGYRLDGQGFGVQVLAGERFFSSPNHPD